MIQPHYKTPRLLSLYRSGEISVVIGYLIAGALTSLTDYSLFFVFLNVVDAGLLAATIVAYVGGLLVSYALSRYWVFRKNAQGQQVATSVWRYGTLLAVNLVITYLMLWALENWLGISPLIGKFIVWFFMIFWIYAANRVWVFKGPRRLTSNFYFARQRKK